MNIDVPTLAEYFAHLNHTGGRLPAIEDIPAPVDRWRLEYAVSLADVKRMRRCADLYLKYARLVERTTGENPDSKDVMVISYNLRRRKFVGTGLEVQLNEVLCRILLDEDGVVSYARLVIVGDKSMWKKIRHLNPLIKKIKESKL